MRRTTQALSFASTLAVIAVFAGCGGGGGGATPASVPVSTPHPTPTVKPTPVLSPTPTPIPVVTGSPAVPSSATFTVYTANVDNQTLVSMAPVGAGAPDATHSWSAAPGAYVIYPDRSIQLTDATGSFDAAQAAWTVANSSAIALNPNASPQLRIAAPSSLTAAVPLATSVLPVATFDSTLASGTAIPSTFRDLVVVPSGAAMFDDEVRVFEAVGQDSTGGLVNVAPAVTWSLALPAGCAGSPAGSLAVDSANGSIVTYHPPANGTFAGACYDQVVASVTGAGSANPISSSANAIYFALSQAVTFPGTVTSGGKPVANAIVDLYGGAAGPGFGDLLALTNYSGAFVRNVPPQRPVTPFADNITLSLTNPSVAAYTLAPSNVPVGPSGGKPASTPFAEGGPFTSPYAPAPAAAFNVLNSFEVANIGLLDAPFGLPNASGGLPPCSVGAFITGSSTVAGCGGKVSAGGAYGGWSASAVADPTTGGLDLAFLQPAGGIGQMALAVQTNVTAYTDPNGSGSDSTAPHCSTATPCAYYARYYNPAGIGSSLPAPIVRNNLPAGTMLQIDGVLLSTTQGSMYNANIIRNAYSTSFQTAGQPERAYTEAFQYPFGAAQVNFIDRWYNSAGQQGGNFTFNRTNTATGYTLSGSGTQSYFRAGFAPTSINYTLSNGVAVTTPGAVSETYTTSASNGSNQTNISWSWTGLAQVGSTATGSIMNAGGTVNATFTVDATGDVTVTESAANGGGVQQFLLQ